MKKAYIVISILALAGPVGTSVAYDSGARALGPAIGATDYYKITCSSGPTDHLNFTITDHTGLSTDEQTLNAQVSKDGLLVPESGITPGKTKELILHGGNGKYTVSVDTFGTSPSLPGTQKYKLGFQCLNAAGQRTKTSKRQISGKLKNDKTKTYAVTCRRRKNIGDTDNLSVTVSNTTKSAQGLMAQLINGSSAINTTDGNTASMKNGRGEYYLTIDNTATDSGRNNSKQYSFQANCVNSSNENTVEPVVETLQDQ